jgi:tetratricopeptide (TPR) repeat protein
MAMGMTLAARQRWVLGRDAFERGRYEEAIAELEHAIELAPDFPDLHNLLGLALGLTGARERAAASFQRALQQNPRYVEARMNLAIVYNDLGRYDEALEAFRAEQPRDPDHGNLSPDVRSYLADSHGLLGDTYRNLGLNADAAQEFRKALKAAPQFLDIKNKLGSVLGEMGLHDDAEAELNATLAQNPRYVDARVTLGIVHYRAGRRHRAREEWEECLREQPDHVRARAYLELLDRESAATEDAHPR